jgi:hypothetical protein
MIKYKVKTPPTYLSYKVRTKATFLRGKRYPCQRKGLGHRRAYEEEKIANLRN